MKSSELHKKAADAAFQGDSATLQECFNRGLSPDDRGVFLNALQNGDLETVQVILNSGGDINQTFDATGSPLISALRHNHRHLLEFILSLDVDPNLGSWGHWLPPLSVAVRFTIDLKWIRILLEKGARIKGTGALHVASILGNRERMRLLLEYGADVNEAPFMNVIAFVNYHGGGTPLHWAIAGGHLEAVSLLLEHHPDLSIPNKEGITLLKLLPITPADSKEEGQSSSHHSSAQSIFQPYPSYEWSSLICQEVPKIRNHRRETNISTNLDAFPESGLPSRLSSSALEATRANMETCLHDLPAELLFLVVHFLEEEEDINSLAQANSRLYDLLNPYLYRRNSRNAQSSALLWAAQSGTEATVQHCLLNGANIGVVDKLGRSPLFCAASAGHEAAVKLLLEIGKVDADSGGSCGLTPLSTAATKGHSAIAKLLLATGRVDINAGRSTGTTPLWEAASEGHEEMVRMLLQTGKAEIDSIKDYDDCTSFFMAASNGHTAVVKLLLETGRVDVDSKNFYNRTLLWRAVSNGHEAVVKLLLETGKVDVNSKDHEGNTPLSEAASKGHEMVVRLLLETEGVDVHLTNLDGFTALSRAASKGHEAVVCLLQAAERL